MSPRGAFSPDSVGLIYTRATMSVLETIIRSTQKLRDTYGLSGKTSIAGR
ncbi:hypothetical protein GBAR_LOCUS14436 [Geodia barretti]|uniref:Uncharacterized protein n=1 Tax=Geodia barretti TaxID=519541 RepID=A0AA35SAG6_GEOBA|nr:hypothetical protein GBAR_LOCUS14436 [Geodia barretti]